MVRVTIVKSGRINIFPATPRVLNAPVDLATKPKVPRHAMVFLLDPTVGTVKCVNVKQVIIAPANPPIKPLVILGRMQPKQARLHVSNAHLEHTPTRLAQLLVRCVTLIRTNPNPMLQNAFKSKKGTTNRVQQQKLNAQQVKPVLVVTKRVKIVKLVGIKNYQGTPRVVNAPLDLATKLRVQRHAMLFLPGRTVGTV